MAYHDQASQTQRLVGTARRAPTSKWAVGKNFGHRHEPCKHFRSQVQLGNEPKKLLNSEKNHFRVK